VLAPGKDFGAYSAAKAAEAQLARVLAIENGEHGIRVNMVNPDGVFEDSGLWEMIGPSRARSYGISSRELKTFYQNRNLMKTAVLPSDVAESVAFLLSSKSSKTTGCILTVDGGVKEAFPR
jgi:NAD(P)-dependent dehydrogenase (short-subunit alcohol dehydrogenase family)